MFFRGTVALYLLLRVRSNLPEYLVTCEWRAGADGDPTQQQPAVLYDRFERRLGVAQ